MGKPHKLVGLILACDLTDEGHLGPHTISRLHRSMVWHTESGGALVVAAGNSPYHPMQSATMAELMKIWIVVEHRRYFTPVIIKKATTFDTRGELNALREIEANEYAIITAWWHLPRAKLIAWQVFPKGVVVKGVADWADRPSLRQLVLEVPKYIHTVLPPSWRIKARRFWEKHIGRSSW